VPEPGSWNAAANWGPRDYLPKQTAQLATLCWNCVYLVVIRRSP
jgi:hypothetical protein